MIEKKSDHLPDIFFDELPALETLLMAGERQVPNWRWFWMIGALGILGAAFLAADALWFGALPTSIFSALQLLAPTLGFAAMAFHQWPRLRVQINAKAPQKTAGD
jgi:hypothetical protein